MSRLDLQVTIDAKAVGYGDGFQDYVTVRERFVMLACIVDDASKLLDLRVGAKPVKDAEHEVIVVVVVAKDGLKLGLQTFVPPVCNYLTASLLMIT